MRTYKDLSEQILRQLHFKYNPGSEEDAALDTRVVMKSSYMQVTQHVGSQIRNTSIFYIDSGRISFSWETGVYEAGDEMLAKLWQQYTLYGK